MKRHRHARIHKERMPLRVYYSKISISTLCFSCIISCILVTVGFSLIFSGKIMPIFTIAMCLLVCFFTMCIGGHKLLKKANNIVKPIEDVTKAVEKVATGDFNVQIKLEEHKTKIDELENLVDNFNRMARELNGMDYMRKDFMSNVSHEVKTPIAAIAGFTEILMDDGLSEEERKEYLWLVNEEAIRLSRLCENMLRMSRLDNQEIVTRSELISVDEQIRKSVIVLAEKWEDKNIEFDLDVDELKIHSDPDLLQQIWMNLIDNAIKYSKDGTTIHISGHIDGDGINISIRDEGIGISKDKQKHIFEKFYQCDESHKKHGNGLGLSIVKRVIELLDGSITCNSNEGVGTEMLVKLHAQEKYI